MEIIINFKTYKFGKDVLDLAKQMEKINKNIIIGVQPTDIYLISKNTELKVYSQHVDSIEPERATGFITPESVISAGAVGVFLNHSEHPIKFEILKKTIQRCKDVGLKTAVFASSLEESKKIEELNPNYLIYEPPELVAGNISVSNSKPEMIKKISKEIKMPFLVGAGIKTSEDVKKSIELGASGFAISSAITKSENPGEVLRELIK
jgi:triosephosphate isomerase (TIM)